MEFEIYPVTTGFLLGTAAGFFVSVLGFGWIIAFAPDRALEMPWTFATYPFACLGPPVTVFTSAVFAGLTFWFVGKELERLLASARWALFLALTTLAGSFGALFIGLVSRQNLTLCEPWLIIGGALLFWALLDPGRELLLWGMFPLRVIWIAVFVIAVNFLGLLRFGPYQAALASAPPGIAWLWAVFRRRRGRRRGELKTTKRLRHLRRIK